MRRKTGIAVVDIPNAFVQTVADEEDAEHRVIVHIRGPLVDILVSIGRDVYGPYVSTNKSGQKVLIVECLNAVYGTIMAALLYYKKFVKSLTKQGFKLNPYDGCVANKIVKGKQIIICFHVDNLQDLPQMHEGGSEDPQFPGDRQTALELALALANTSKSSTRVFLLS
jgi:hypothetical protein